MARETSIETYKKIMESGLLPDKRSKVYDIIYQSGAEGITGTRVAQQFKLRYPSGNHSESIRNRITELVKQKVVDEIGIVSCKVTGNKVMLFRCNDNLPVKLPKVKTKGQKKQDALDVVCNLAKSELSEAQMNELRNLYRLIKKI